MSPRPAAPGASPAENRAVDPLLDGAYPGPGVEAATAGLLVGADSSLLDLVDHLLNQGVSITGDVILGLAGVDLVYLRLSVILCAADRVLPRAGRPDREPA